MGADVAVALGRGGTVALGAAGANVGVAAVGAWLTGGALVAVALGGGGVAVGTDRVAVGASCVAVGTGCVAVGAGAARRCRGVAVGGGALVGAGRAVALGRGV
jgi:hypothetical protein